MPTTEDEIIKAVRQNILFGAKVIKIMVDSKPYGYSVEEMELFVREAERADMKVDRTHPDARGSSPSDRGRALVARPFRSSG